MSTPNIMISITYLPQRKQQFENMKLFCKDNNIQIDSANISGGKYFIIFPMSTNQFIQFHQIINKTDLKTLNKLL
jgi:hypothetical protein